MTDLNDIYITPPNQAFQKSPLFFLTLLEGAGSMAVLGDWNLQATEQVWHGW